MKISKRIATCGVVGIVALAAGSGCNDGQPGDDEGTTATVEMALSGVDYAGNSVFITATRSGTPDKKYGACKTSVSGCFAFDTAGVVQDTTNAFTNLCPTADVNDVTTPGTGTWTFSYAVFSDVACGGTQLNGNNHNFECFDFKNIGTHANPNGSVESLNPGRNTNIIACETKPASKTFDFGTCWDISPPNATKTTYDCGCKSTATPGVCDCSDQFGNTASTASPPDNCAFIAASSMPGSLCVISCN